MLEMYKDERYTCNDLKGKPGVHSELD